MAIDHALDVAIDEAVRVLQPIFSRPKLRRRLLAKPPFRFIHDIVMAVIQSTKFPASRYFTDSELESSTFKNDKNAKLEFLDKIIELVTSAGIDVCAESKNIVAGVQPAATLTLLVEFAKMATNDSIDQTSLLTLRNRKEETQTKQEVENVSDEGKNNDSGSDSCGEVGNSGAIRSDSVASPIEEVNIEHMSMEEAIESIIKSAATIESLFEENGM